MRSLAALLVLSLLAPAADPPGADEARAAHKAELARLRAKLLDDIDAVVKSEHARGAGIDYLLKERKGFEENGVVPILPKLRPATRAYLEAKEAADDKLAAALGRKPEARPKPPEAPKAPDPAAVKTAADLERFLTGTVWDWGDGEVEFSPEGIVTRHAGWAKAGLVTRWGAVDRRTVALRIESGRDRDRVAVLVFADDLTKFGGLDFSGGKMDVTRPRKR
jgi:hypothetical protein